MNSNARLHQFYTCTMNGSGTETGNRNWKWKLETEMEKKNVCQLLPQDNAQNGWLYG